MEKKLIYILNHYSKNSVQHFYHIINLLEKIADEGVSIALVIEKCDEIPVINSKNIKIIAQKKRNKVIRIIELYKIISHLIKVEKYDKIFIRISTNASIVAIVAAKLHKAKTFYWQSGAAFEIYRKLQFIYRLKWYITSYSRFWFVKKNIDYFVTGPESMIEYYVNEANVKREKIRLLYNDIDTKRFSPISEQEKITIREKLGLQIDRKYVLLVHRFSPVRKTGYYIPYIMEDSKHFETVDFLLIGGGPDRELVNEQIRMSSNKNIYMLGEKDNASIQDYYKACDVFINPSYTEGFPRVVIEAMACGLPIVATNAGGTKDLFGKNQSDFIVSTEDRELFRQKLIRMLENKDIQEKCSKENILQSNNFSTENVAKMYIDVIWGY